VGLLLRRRISTKKQVGRLNAERRAPNEGAQHCGLDLLPKVVLIRELGAYFANSDANSRLIMRAISKKFYPKKNMHLIRQNLVD
jgi:hypothetical protein